MGLTVNLKNDVSTRKRGTRNLMTDVPGVKVANVTIDENDVHTGVTAILPQSGNLFLEKVPAASNVINGFGKSVGLIQINELGTIETPILLTNTFGVGTALNALTKYMMKQNSDIGDTTSTVNPIVMECNDGDVSNIRKMAVTEDNVLQAIKRAGAQFEEGAVGSGRGMMCYDLKGGIGSSSRVIEVDDATYTVGTLVMSNFGFLGDLVIDGEPIGEEIAKFFKASQKKEEHGSIITVIATDAPLNSRQLKRLANRATVGITSTGSFIGHGSGEIVIAFSTANRVSQYPKQQITTVQSFNDEKIDAFFRAVAASVDESVRSSLVHAESVVDRKGKLRLSLPDALKKMTGDSQVNQAMVTKVKLALGVE